MIDTTGQPNQLAAHLVRMQRSAAAKWQLNFIPALPFCHVRLSGPKPLPKAYPKHLKTLGDHIRKRRLDREFSRSVRDSRQPALLSSVRRRGASDSEPEYHTTDS